MRFQFLVAAGIMCMAFEEAQGADTCKAILAGLYDFRSVENEDAVVNSLYNSSCSKYLSYKNASNKDGTKIGLDIVDELGFNLDKQNQASNIQNSINELCTTGSLDSSNRTKLVEFIRSVNSKVVDAWSKCMDQGGVNLSAIYTANAKEITLAISYRPYFNGDSNEVIIESSNLGYGSSPISDCGELKEGKPIGNLRYFTCKRTSDAPGILWFNIVNRAAVSVEVLAAPFEGEPLFSIATDGPVKVPAAKGGGIAEIKQEGIMIVGTRDTSEFFSELTARYVDPEIYKGYQTRTSKKDGCRFVTKQTGIVTGKRKYCVDAVIIESSAFCGQTRKFYQRTCVDGDNVDVQEYIQ